mgnify:CR=1 FL=1
MWEEKAKTRVKTALYHYIPVVLVGLAVLAWFRWAPSRQTVDPKAPAVQAPTPKKTAKLPLRSIQAAVRVVDKEAVEKAIPGALSLETRANQAKFVFPPAELDPWAGKRIVTPVLDNTTGEVHVEDKRLPPPWIEWKKEFVADGRYLFAGDHTAELDIKAIPLRINARDGGVTIDPYVFGGVDFRRSDSSIGGRAGVGVQVRF